MQEQLPDSLVRVEADKEQRYAAAHAQPQAALEPIYRQVAPTSPIGERPSDAAPQPWKHYKVDAAGGLTVATNTEVVLPQSQIPQPRMPE